MDQEESKAPTLINVDEVQRRFGGMSRATLYRDVKAGRLPQPIKHGGRSLFAESEIDDAVRKMLAARRQPESAVEA